MTDDSAYRCVLCARDLPDDAPICRNCHRKLDERLEDIPCRYAMLPAFLQPGSGTDGTGIRTPLGSKPPIRLDVVDQMYRETVDAVLPKLESWVRMVREEKGWQPAEGPCTVVGEVGFLRAHLEWIVAQGWLPDFETEIRQTHNRLRELCGEVRPKPVTFCPVEVDGEVCATPLYVRPYAFALRCQRCGAYFDEHHLRWLGRIQREGEAG